MSSGGRQRNAYPHGAVWARLVAVLLACLSPGCEEQPYSLGVPEYICDAVPLTSVPLNQKLLIAHRGLVSEYPENTEIGLLAAAEHGANAVEFDVVLTADGVPIVLHDYTLNRTTDCTGDVRRMTWDEIEPCRIAGEYPIPKLADLLPKLNIYRKYFLELKSEDDQAKALARRVGALVRENVDFDRAIVTSFNVEALYWLMTLYPYPHIQAAYDGSGAAIPLASINLDLDYMLMRYSDIDRCVFSTAERMGVKIVTYTVEDQEDLDIVMGGLFRDHAWGIMFDFIPVLEANRERLRGSSGEALLTAKECRKQPNHSWDPQRWLCVESCTTTGCGPGHACDERSGLCMPAVDDLEQIQGLFREIQQFGRYDGDGDDDDRAMLEAFAALFAPESPYAGHDALLHDQLLVMAAGPNSHVGFIVESVRIERPRAVVHTVNGVEWFLVFEDGRWCIDYFQS